ncbi:MAG: DUF2490 domain-containing protein [Candidatus Glassbacteria bacterium]|nr:DUF2490 domain-containing protein [Candidatus Glassbacteria bacterium]
MKAVLCLLAINIMLLAAVPASAGDTEHWGEYGIQLKFSDRFSLKSDVQLRFRDGISDFYWYRFEAGPNFKLNDRINITVLGRIKPQQYGDEWRRQYNIFIDPVFKIAHNGTTTFDLRTRVQTKLTGEGWQFLRLRPRLTHRFYLGELRCAWFLYNDFWLQFSALGARDRYNVNWLGTGVKFGLKRPVDFSVYLQYRSDKLPATGRWDHDPVLGTRLRYRF